MAFTVSGFFGLRVEKETGLRAGLKRAREADIGHAGEMVEKGRGLRAGLMQIEEAPRPALILG